MRIPNPLYLPVLIGGIMAIGIAPHVIWWLYQTRGAIGFWEWLGPDRHPEMGLSFWKWRIVASIAIALFSLILGTIIIGLFVEVAKSVRQLAKRLDV